MKKTAELQYTEDNISLFIHRFTTGHWAQQGEVNLEKCSTQYIPPNEKCHLTPKLVAQHLDTEITLASYTITRNNTCRFLVIDFDIDTIIAKNSIGNPGSAAARKMREDALTSIQKEVQEAVAKMSDVLKINRNQLLIERSGVKGYHIWMFFQDEVPAIDAYRLTRILANEIGLTGYEIYPMQPSGDDTRPGSLIKLPLGVNRKNWERCLFLDDTFEPVAEGQWAALENVDTISNSQLNNMLKLKDTEADRIEDDSIEDVSQIGGSIDRMINKCAALSVLRDKAIHADKDNCDVNLTHDERLCVLSLFKKFGVVGKSRIHEFMQNTDNYDMEKTNKYIEDSTLKPMRCETMQQRGLCQSNCAAILACNGRSPIKLAMGENRGGKDGVYVLNSLAEIENPIICGRNIRVDFTVCSLVDSPYYSTKKICFGKCSEAGCPDYMNKCMCEEKDEVKTVQITDSDRLHIQLYGVDDKKAIGLIKSKVEGCTKPDRLHTQGRPEKNVVQPFTLSNIVYSVNQESMDKMKAETDSSRDPNEGSSMAAKEMKDYLGFFLGSSLETSKTYRGYGTVLPNPHNQSITILFKDIEPLNSHIEGFEIDDTNRDLFEQFKSLTLNEIIDDLRNNVCYVYGRDDVIMAILLTHFSALGFTFNNTPIKGWVESIIIGDTGQAKSLLTERILNYIGLGKVGGANMSYAGLIGGVERLQNKSFINWGLFPRCNKGLIFLDEIQNIKADIMMNLRTARQQGFAEVNKIVKGRHETKVRLICAANPMPADKTMSSFKYGATSLTSVPCIGGPDIRRFDIACFVNSADTRPEDVNKLNDLNTPIISSDMLRTAILWMWSRKPEQIHISIDVTKKILEGAMYLGDKFDVSTNSVPICNRNDMREKLARLIVSMAGIRGRTPDNINLYPAVEDAEYVIGLLDSIYSDKSVLLDRMVAEKKRECNLDASQYRELKAYLDNEGYSKMRKVITGLIDMNQIRPADLGGWAQASGEEMSRIIAVLNKYQMIAMAQFGCYSPTPKLSKFHAMLMDEEAGGEDDGCIF